MNAGAHGNFTGKHLVVFGCGYVGATVAREALARGLRVSALTRNEAKAISLRADGVDTVVADLSSADWHERIGGEAEFMLNCVSSGGGGLDGYRKSYVDGMASVMTWAEQRRVAGTMIYTSSTSVYPQGGGARIDEYAATDGAGDRAKLLIEAESKLGSGARASLRWFVLRLAGIYGPGRHHLLEQVRLGEIAGRGDHHLNLIHRDDICAAIWAAFGASAEVKNEVFNVADDHAATKAEVTDWLATRLGLPAPRFTGERGAGRRPETPDRIILNGKLKAVLGWRPRYPSFREGYENILSR